jgi:hypothetical protein
MIMDFILHDFGELHVAISEYRGLLSINVIAQKDLSEHNVSQNDYRNAWGARGRPRQRTRSARK